jgi:sodium-coupled neutral amino acid transporter 11
LALTCGIFGYAGYLDATDGNILNNLGDSVSANLARALMGTAMLCVYPLESFVARHVCVAVLFSGQRAHDGDSDSSILNRRDRRIGLTFLLYVMAVLPAAFVSDMGSVLALTGAVGGSCLSYIGPGLIYLGIHGGRFLDLVSDGWLGCMLRAQQRPALEIADSAGAPDNMVETTPLVTGESHRTLSTNGSTEVSVDDDADVEADGRDPLYLLKAAVWYMCGFPLWCAIAGFGRKGLTRHVHDLTLKSPHPIRIGNVEYSRVLLSEIEKGGMNISWPLQRQYHSFSSFSGVDGPPTIIAPPNKALLSPAVDGNGSAPAAPVGQSVNARIGQDLLRKQQQVRQAKEAQQDAIEADPQDVPPGAKDFALAIFYILFGFMALVVGILSLFVEKE